MYGLAVAGMVAYTFTFELQMIVVSFITAGFVGYKIYNDSSESIIKNQGSSET